MTVAQEKASAKNEIVESVRDLLSLKITLPLGNPDLKLVHTNQFCQTELPDEFLLENFSIIAKALNSAYNRNVGYTIHKWYIEGRTVTNDGNKFTMDLDLNPFASTLLNFKDNRASYINAYKDAVKQAKNENATSTNTTNNVASVTGNTTLKGGEGKVIDDLAKSIVGKETNALKKAKLIHSWLIKNVSYKYYACTKYNTAEKCYNNRGHLNCADTARLTRALMASAGLEAYVVHGTNHFWCVVKINGKEYASDATSHSRKFGQVYKGLKYYAKNGKNPSC